MPPMSGKFNWNEVGGRIEAAIATSAPHQEVYTTFRTLVETGKRGQLSGKDVFTALEAGGLLLSEFVKADGERLERQERLRVMTEMGAVLGEELGLAPERRALEGLFLAMMLCGEDEVLLRLPDRDDLQSSAEAFRPHLARAKECLLSATVHYEGEVGRGATCRLTIFTVQDGEPVKSLIDSRLAWGDLPPQLRERFLGEGKKSVGFRLYGE